MALLNVIRGEESKILAQPVSDGALLFATDTKKIYLDKGSERIEIASIQDLSNYVTSSQLQEGLNTKAPLSHSHTVSQVTDLDTTISAAIGEEASARQKQDQLLEQSIDDKLGADDIIAGSNVQVSHDDESGHITISATDTTYTAGAGLTLSGTEFGIADGGIIGRYLDDNCVMERNIVVGSVTSDKIPALAITTPKLADNAVTAIKMADDAVATRSIQNGAVTADKLAEGVIPEIPEVTLASLGVTATAQELNYTDGVTSNIQTQLDGKAASSHTHNVATTGSAGFLRQLDGDTSHYLRGDGTWGAVEGAGSDLILVQSTEPTSSNCKLWIKPQRLIDGQIEINSVCPFLLSNECISILSFGQNHFSIGLS